MDDDDVRIVLNLDKSAGYFVQDTHSMPTIKRIGPYRFFFYAGDRSEPPHVHVERENKVAKFWLAPVRLQSSGGFRPHEIRRIQRLVEDEEQAFLEAWYEYFGE